MRAPLFLAPLVILLACTDKDDGSDAGRGGQSTSGGVANIAGSTTTGGTTATSGGTGSATGGASAAGGKKGQDLVDCDLRKVTCRIVQPTCAENQVPSVEGSCFGACVPIESCACSVAQDCPFEERYTCWQRTHCGPYVR